jgi:hypothetical protein
MHIWFEPFVWAVLHATYGARKDGPGYPEQASKQVFCI